MVTLSLLGGILRKEKKHADRIASPGCHNHNRQFVPWSEGLSTVTFCCYGLISTVHISIVPVTTNETYTSREVQVLPL